MYTDDLNPPHQPVGFPNITDGMIDACMLGDAASCGCLEMGVSQCFDRMKGACRSGTVTLPCSSLLARPHRMVTHSDATIYSSGFKYCFDTVSTKTYTCIL
jgi:hypothetical protein